MEYEYYPYEPQRSSVVLANFRNNLGKLLANLADSRNKLNSLLTPAGKVKVAWLENIIARLQTEIDAGLLKKAVVHDDGDIWVDDIENPTKAMSIVNGMFAIANSKKENGDWNWRTFGTGEGFTADLINAGVVRLAEALTVENADGTVKLTADGLRVVDGDARAAFLNNAISMQIKSGDVWVDKIYFDPATGNYVFDGTLSANVINAVKANIDVIVNNTFITQNLYAERGTIAELTVDQLDTSDKVANYLAGNKADAHYIRAYDQHVEFIEAKYALKQHWDTYPQSPELTATYPYQVIINAAGNIRLIVSSAKWYYFLSGDTQLKSSVAGKMYQLNVDTWEYVSEATNYSYTEILQANADVYNDVSLTTVLFTATHSDHVQLTDRNGQRVYWIDETHTGTTLEVTDYPVYIYIYDEQVKMDMAFDTVDGVYVPVITFGAGFGNPDYPERGKSRLFKDALGAVWRYTTSQGIVQDIRNGENGIEGIGGGGVGGLPPGGTTGQVLVKKSNADGDVGWGDVAGSGDGVILAPYGGYVIGSIEPPLIIEEVIR
jgi:hypothetical protein